MRASNFVRASFCCVSFCLKLRVVVGECGNDFPAVVLLRARHWGVVGSCAPLRPIAQSAALRRAAPQRAAAPHIKAPDVKNFAWLPVGVNSNKPARGSVSLI